MSCMAAATVIAIPPLILACILSCMQAPTIDLESQTEVAAYTIFYKESSAGDFTAVTLPASVTSYRILSPALFSTYQVKLTATNVGGTSAESGTVSKGKCVTIHVKRSCAVHENCLWYVYRCRMWCKP